MVTIILWSAQKKMASSPMLSTGYPGVYYRLGSGKKRSLPNGSFDKCLIIRYRIEDKWHYETVGWEAEGATVEKAVALRLTRLKNPPPPPAESKPRAEYVMKRCNTGRVGVYYRYAKTRLDANGKPDKCFDILYDKNGKTIFEKVGWTSEGYTLDDAVAIRGARVKAIRHPELCPDESERIFGVTLHQIWEVYKTRELPNLKGRKNIEINYTVHICPRFGERTIASIEAGEVEDFKNHLLSTVSATTGRVLTPGSVKVILSNLRRIINRGITWGLVKKKINAASQIHVADSDRQREQYLSPEQAEKLFDCLECFSCQLFFIAKIGLYTGMRLNEILELRWQSIDLNADIIHLNGKTGRRPAYISAELKPIFIKLKPQNASDLLFATKAGKKLSLQNISGRFRKIVDALGFNDGVTDNTKRVVFHTLRHTFCSWLAMKGVPLYTIGRLVGHTSPEMTQRYAKLAPGCQKDALRHIGDMLHGVHS